MARRRRAIAACPRCAHESVERMNNGLPDWMLKDYKDEVLATALTIGALVDAACSPLFSNHSHTIR
jgi:hypothetical protein